MGGAVRSAYCDAKPQLSVNRLRSTAWRWRSATCAGFCSGCSENAREEAVELVTALSGFLAERGRLAEARRWLEVGLDRARTLSPRLYVQGRDKR